MAGQFTFTNGPDLHGERAWTRRAIMSFPVPLSPWIRTGTFAEATLSSRERKACISSDWPKTTASGGISPKDCARELTEFVTVLDINDATFAIHARVCTPSTKLCGNLVIDEKTRLIRDN